MTSNPASPGASVSPSGADPARGAIPGVRRVEAPPLTWAERLYLPEVLRGLVTTLKHLLFRRAFTVRYPEEKRTPPPGSRGEHYLKKDAEGRVKCVACFLCATACPAECIYIEAAESPWPDRDKIPSKFTIDMLKCIYCGMCEEACPCDAIALSPKPFSIFEDRAGAMFDKEKLLANWSGSDRAGVFPQ